MRYDRERLRHLSQQRLGYDRLRPGQEAAIQALIEGHDTLAVMPTGSGKSAIYQLAGMQLSGPVIIVSPLIALQRDQVETIEEQQIGEAALVNSTLTSADREATLEDLAHRELKFIFLAPEQFTDDEMLAAPDATVNQRKRCCSIALRI